MYYDEEHKVFIIRDTNFKFKTNFAGDPEKDNFGSTARKANILLPQDVADEMAEMGIEVKQTKPSKDATPQQIAEFVPQLFVPIKAKYRNKFGKEIPDRYKPVVYLICGEEEPRRLTEETIGIIDEIAVANVKVSLNPYYDEMNRRWSLSIVTMYVEQDLKRDPFANDYSRRRDEDDDEVPFD